MSCSGTCLYCGAPTYAKYKSQLKKFCSRKCSNRWKWENIRKRKEFIVFTCPNCNGEVLIDKADYRIKEGRTDFFCSTKCWSEYCQKQHTIKACPICGTKFTGKNKSCSSICSLELSKWHALERRVGAIFNSYSEYLLEVDRINQERDKEAEEKRRNRRIMTNEEKREQQKRRSAKRRLNPEYRLWLKRYLREYNKAHLEERRIKERERIAADPIYRFKTSVRKMICCSFSRKGKVKSRKAEDILGCTIDDFILYLQSLFVDGMSFENHGKWHIDHIVPLATAKTEEDIIKLCHYTNLQPLWAHDNISKGSKII